MWPLLRWLLAIGLLLASPGLAAAQGDPFALLFGDEEEVDASQNDRPGEDDLRFVGLRLGGLKLKGTLTAYARPEGLCLLAGGVFEHLDAPVEVTESGAEGWFVSPERTLSIDATTASAALHDGRHIDLSGELFDTPEGWCMVESAWSRLLPIDFSYQASSLSLQMEPRETLPLEARLEREALRERLDMMRGPARPDYRDIDNPYRWLTWPTADFSVDLRASGEGAADLSGQAEIAGDVLWATARVRSAQDDNGDMGMRVSFDRVFAGGSDGWKPTRVRFGDVTTRGQPLMPRTESGRGITLTNRPAYAADVFDVTDIRGPLPAGWDAELYRDAQLIDFVTGPDGQGEYAFEDVEILPGYNRFTVKLFGPYGETDSREVKFFAGNEMHPENDVQYDLSIVQEQVSVDGATTGPGDWVAAASVGFGVTQNVTSRLDVRASEQDGSSAVASAIGAFGSTHGVIRLGLQETRPPELEAGAVHLFENRSVLDARYRWHGDSPSGGGQGSGVRQSASLDVDTLLPVTAWGLPLKSRLEWDDLIEDGHRFAASARVSSSWGAWRWSHITRLDSRPSDTGRQTDLSGSLNLSRNLSGLRVRSGMTYEMGPDPAFETVDVTLQKRFDTGSFAQWTLARDMASGRLQSGASLAHDFKGLTVSANAGVNDQGRWTAGIRLSTALFFDRRAGRYRSAPPGLSRTGAIRASVFDDLDHDGRLGDDDRAMAGASFILDRSIRRDESGADGSMVLTGVETHRPVDLELSLGSLDDPFLQPVEAGLAITVRPGQVVDVDVPLTLTGEADASVILMNGENRVPVAGVLVEAVAPDGSVVATATSEYDGYVYLDGLPMGTFELRVSPGALDEIGARSTSATIKLTRDAPSVFGTPLVIERI